MTITPDDIRRVAALAALEIAETEVGKVAAELDAIVRYVGQLGELTAAADPEFLAGPATAPLRPDEPGSTPLTRAPADFAPEFRDGFFLVPRLAGREDG